MNFIVRLIGRLSGQPSPDQDKKFMFLSLFLVPKVVCSKPSPKFVKKFLRFSCFRQGYWEENSTKTHQQRPEKCSMAPGGKLCGTKSDRSATNSD